MDLMYYVNALLLGFVVASVTGFIVMFFKFFFQFRQLEIIARGSAISAFLKLETIEHKGEPYFLVYEPMNKNKFITQGSSIDEISKFIVENYKGKTVFIAEDGKDMIKLFSHTENV